ncbi:H(+)/Cl(-) exchange transporter 6-like [Babylonia areolata]|uniref:H(+)/Cl(-) exchange transporter 6-like n=1 Tax=Babylonia areolata TaxID=304850 RepID=UPI003FD09AF5
MAGLGADDFSVHSSYQDTERPRERPAAQEPRAVIKDYESLDYDRCYNKPYDSLLNRLGQGHSAAKLEAIKWIVTFLIGFLTAMVALFIDVVVKHLSTLKFHTVDQSIQQCGQEGCLAVSLIYLLLFNVGFVIIASALVVYEPVAGGSGIPEIKSYLNGVKVPRVARLLSLVAKAVGVLFSVAGGLFVGKEGPMIHSGAIIGAGVPQFQSLAFRKINFKYSFFRTDRDKRDFVSGGAAAGVAAAFGAPIGGVLFSLEEGSSFWNQALTWRTFFCSMAATFSLNFFLSGLDSNSWGYFYLPGLIDFGEFKCQSSTNKGCTLWGAADLLIFIVMGCVGGLLGGLFNGINRALTVYRMKHVQKKRKFVRILEAILVIMTTTTVAFVAAMTLGDCRKMPHATGESLGGAEINSTVRTYFCQAGYYNDMATLFFNPQEVAIKQLFHQAGTFSIPSLGIFFICFFLLACWTYGVAVPSGLFVPSLLCGAAYGRFVASILETVFGYKSVYSGTYALIGAAALLGGIVRMTISLTVILIESTNEISYGLPIMIVLMVAKWVGDLFNKGIYDIHIDLKEVPFLEWETPADVAKLKARDIVEPRRLSVVFPQTRVASLVKILKTTAHGAFPVVSLLGSEVESQSLMSFENHKENDQVDSFVNDEPDFPRESQMEDMADINFRRRSVKFEGIILRSHIAMVLKRQAWSPDGRGGLRLMSRGSCNGATDSTSVSAHPPPANLDPRKPPDFTNVEGSGKGHVETPLSAAPNTCPDVLASAEVPEQPASNATVAPPMTPSSPEQPCCREAHPTPDHGATQGYGVHVYTPTPDTLDDSETLVKQPFSVSSHGMDLENQPLETGGGSLSRSMHLLSGALPVPQ